MDSFIIIAAALVIYSCRLAGFILNFNKMSPQSERFLHFLPICVLSALVVPSLLAEPAAIGFKSIALLIAGGILWKTGRFGIAIIVRLAAFWLFTLYAIS